ncbi:MAG: hypothetical protein ACOH1V_13730 [Stenotrophomonas sp.]
MTGETLHTCSFRHHRLDLSAQDLMAGWMTLPEQPDAELTTAANAEAMRAPWPI